MILIDVNLLVYATNAQAKQHVEAREWLERQLSETSRVGMPWASLLGFLRLATQTRSFQRPLKTEQAWEQVTDWLG